MNYKDKFYEIVNALGANLVSEKYGQIKYKGIYISIFFDEAEQVWPPDGLREKGHYIGWIVGNSHKVNTMGAYTPTKTIVRRIQIACTLLLKQSCTPS